MDTLYFEAFEALPGLVCILDADTYLIKDCNSTLEKMLQIGRSEYNSLRFFDLLSKESDKAYAKHAFCGVGRSHQELDEVFMCCSKESNICVKWKVIKLGKSNHLLLTGAVINEPDTAVVQSAPSEESRQAADIPSYPIYLGKQDLIHVLNRLPIGFHSVDCVGHILWANTTLLKILGYAPEEYIGHSFLKFVCELNQVQILGNNTRAGKITYDFPYSLLAKDGSVKRFLVCSDANMKADGSVHFTRTFFKYDMNHAVDEAIAKERMDKLSLIAAEKDRFIRVMFHEIRTPLHSLSNCFAGLIKTNPKMRSTATDEMTYLIDACTGLVEDLSFSTMFESDQVLHPRPVKMNLRKELEYLLNYVSLYRDLELNSRPLSIEREIDIGVPEIVMVDSALLKALSNLIKNAVKYCTPLGRVSIVMTYAENTSSNRAPDISSPTSGASNKSGTLTIKIKNTVIEAMDLVLVNKMFQSCYTNFSLFADRPVSDPSASLFSSPQITPRGGGGGGGGGGGSDKESGSESRPESIASSLVSSEGLGLGLYVAYNIISNLGGLLECSGSESESVFSFSLAVHARSSEAHRLIRGGAAAAGVSSLSTGGAGGLPTGDGSLLLEKLRKKNWFHAIDSVEGNKHVDCSGLKSELSLTVEHVRGHKPRILVVDDSPICRKVLVKALESNGYDTDTACDGKEAVDKLERPPCLYDAVLMDLRMPIMDGITATRVCKSQPHLSELPIIIVTAELGEEVRRECMEAGASHFISKPAKMDEVIQILESHISRLL